MYTLNRINESLNIKLIHHKLIQSKTKDQDGGVKYESSMRQEIPKSKYLTIDPRLK